MSPQSGRLAASGSLAPRLKRLIVETLKLEGLDPESIGDDQLLFGEGLGLDSIDALELVVAIEREFSVAIPEGKVDHDVFHSVRTLASWLADRLAQRAQSDSSDSSDLSNSSQSSQSSPQGARRDARPKAVTP